MLISNVHKSIIVMNSLDARFSKHVFEAVQKTRCTCFIGSKTIRLRLVVLKPIKHSCSFFKHYVMFAFECKQKKEKEMILTTWESWFLSCAAGFEIYNMSLNCHGEL